MFFYTELCPTPSNPLNVRQKPRSRELDILRLQSIRKPEWYDTHFIVLTLEPGRKNFLRIKIGSQHQSWNIILPRVEMIGIP